MYMLQAGTLPAKGHPDQLNAYISAIVKAGTPQKRTVGNRGQIEIKMRFVRAARISSMAVFVKPVLIFDGRYLEPGNPCASTAIVTSQTSIGRAAGSKVDIIITGLGSQNIA
jgi:hypothetical protein